MQHENGNGPNDLNGHPELVSGSHSFTVPRASQGSNNRFHRLTVTQPFILCLFTHPFHRCKSEKRYLCHSERSEESQPRHPELRPGANTLWLLFQDPKSTHAILAHLHTLEVVEYGYAERGKITNKNK